MRKIEISHRTIVFTILLLVGIWFVWQIRQVLLVIFVALLLATALRPAVDRLTTIKIPRIVAILFVYFILIGGFVGILVAIIPPLVDQTTALAAHLPEYLTNIGIQGIDKNIASQLANLGAIPANVLRFATSLFSNLIAVFGVLILSFYLLLERGNIDSRLVALFGQESGRAKAFLDKLEEQLGGWVRGELILMVIIGVATYIGLRLLNIYFALPLALLAGILEIVPGVGPWVAGIPAVIIGFTISPFMGLVVFALYFIIQQIENMFIVPTVMARSVGLSPIVTLLALGVGLELGGILGAVLAVPAVLIGRVTINEFVIKRKVS